MDVSLHLKILTGYLVHRVLTGLPATTRVQRIAGIGIAAFVLAGTLWLAAALVGLTSGLWVSQ